jgi:indolepyruvate ferredoxin oxidoreductase beta subunit
MPVLYGKAEYPSQLPQALASVGLRVETLDARSIACELGDPRVVNTVMLGALAKACNWPRSEFEKSVRASMPKRFVDINIKAFTRGYKALPTGDRMNSNAD